VSNESDDPTAAAGPPSGPEPASPEPPSPEPSSPEPSSPEPSSPELASQPAPDAPPPPPAPPAGATEPAYGALPPPAGYDPAAAVPPGAALPPMPPPTPPPGTDVAPQKGRGGFLGGRLLRIAVTIVVVIVLGLVYSSFRHHHDAASAPGKGSCIWAEGTDTSNPKIHKVDCSDAKAQYTVLDKISGGDDSDCDSVTGTDATYTETDNDKPVYVLCLQQKK
jgi:hypothetical protein